MGLWGGAIARSPILFRRMTATAPARFDRRHPASANDTPIDKAPNGADKQQDERHERAAKRHLP
ncbi:hypothetical protein EBBID32_38180 [Sphingobium indicum BiD32]|uniref:Uncharacterized protein n=1 Tax=Sphingobium indicum BiD32 TaxID=1301087 RepID=N1MUZ9_9SPHN|nr:hypothetical protein EBBID32_38180 [Sphingobium indicum BiD32]